MTTLFRVISWVLLVLCAGEFASANLYEKVEVDQSGKPVLISHKDASYLCLLRGLRLPTAREVAEDAATSGLKVQDTQYPNLDISSPEIIAEERGRAYLMKSNGSGFGVLFYYSTRDYQYQNKPVLAIWTSSICPQGSPQCEGLDEFKPYKFNVASGVFSSYDWDQAAVACVR